MGINARKTRFLATVFAPFQRHNIGSAALAFIFNLDGFKAEAKGTVTYFASKICKTEAAQFEIRADFRIIERKPDSSKAISQPDPA